jgi:hypothetical protein
VGVDRDVLAGSRIEDRHGACLSVVIPRTPLSKAAGRYIRALLALKVAGSDQDHVADSVKS